MLLSFVLLAAISCQIISESPINTLSCSTQHSLTTDHLAHVELDSLVTKAEREGLVGGTIIAISKSKGTYLRSFGVADIGLGLEMKDCQKYRVASITKVFMGVATLMLVDEGVISLDTVVGDYLDDKYTFDIDGIEEVTVEQLLNHTSGIPNYDDDFRYAQMILNEPGRTITLEQKLDLIRGKNRAPDWVIRKFGQLYSNTNYLVLQLILEKASGQSYEDFLRKRIIEPLRLDDTSFSSENPYPDGLATGYVDFYGNDIIRDVNEWDAFRFDGEGSMISTAADLSTFYQTLVSGLLLPDHLVEKMKSRRLGLLQEEFDLENALGHDGVGIGYSSEMWYLPDSDLIIILLANQGRLVNENESVLRFENLLRELIHYAR